MLKIHFIIILFLISKYINATILNSNAYKLKPALYHSATSVILLIMM